MHVLIVLWDVCVLLFVFIVAVWRLILTTLGPNGTRTFGVTVCTYFVDLFGCECVCRLRAEHYLSVHRAGRIDAGSLVQQ